MIGVAGPQITVQADVAGLPAQDRNNLIYVPLHAAIFRLEDVNSRFRDEIDGIYLQMRPGEDIPAAAALLRGLLNVSHRGAADLPSSRQRNSSPSSAGHSAFSRW